MRPNELFSAILNNLPKTPADWGDVKGSRFWTNGNQILCPSELECRIVADFFEDVFSELTIVTGYYDSFEDAKNGETDDNTGFWYIDFE